jgi:hypothetical protein
MVLARIPSTLVPLLRWVVLLLHPLQTILLLFQLSLLWKHLHLQLQLLVLNFQLSFVFLQFFSQLGLFFISLCPLF